MATALITGVAGQDGSYLAELLLNKEYRVVGTERSMDSVDFWRIQHLKNDIEIIEDNLKDQHRMEKILRKYQPEEVYNLAAEASSSTLFKTPALVGEINALGVTKILEAIRLVNPKIRFCQASSSEIFGKIKEAPQSETTPFYPRNPYGVAKLYGHWITVTYRENYNMFACSSILYNHESPRRGLEYVTRKITHAVANIKRGSAKEIRLGNLEAQRDWGFAGDYVQAMWLALQQSQPDDYVVATGVTHSVREFCQVAFEYVGLNYLDYVVQDPEFFRPLEKELLVGNPAKSIKNLGWKTKVTFRELVQMMVEADLKGVM
jgi:GDPmannose 4,6-dehydratase